MSEASLLGQHLEDEHHPKSGFMLQAVNIYLNIHREHGPKSAPRHGHSVGSVQKWDEEYIHHQEEMEAEYARDAGAAESRQASLQGCLVRYVAEILGAMAVEHGLAYP